MSNQGEEGGGRRPRPLLVHKWPYSAKVFYVPLQWPRSTNGRILPTLCSTGGRRAQLQVAGYAIESVLPWDTLCPPKMRRKKLSTGYLYVQDKETQEMRLKFYFKLDVDPRRDDKASPMSSNRCMLRPSWMFMDRMIAPINVHSIS